MKKNVLFGSTILITGGTGSWGNELTKQLLNKYNPKEIRIYSRGEHKQVEMRRKFNNPKIQYYIGDVRDKDRLRFAMKNVDYVFHLAALKHVPICEENPWEVVQTNIIGTQNIIETAIENNVKKVIDISTDKAVDPYNLYGVTKACGEKLMIAANNIGKTIFVCIRGGNVMGTNGSVIPLFIEQIKKLNEITITDKRMTRFLMRVQEAIQLVIKAIENSIGGEIYVINMPACKIIDLAQVMIARMGDKKTKIRQIGIRPGEKIYEVLVSKYEMSRTIKKNNYFIILPQIEIFNKKVKRNITNLNNHLSEFNSMNTHLLTKNELEELLDRDGWFDTKLSNEAINYLKSLTKTELMNFSKPYD